MDGRPSRPGHVAQTGGHGVGSSVPPPAALAGLGRDRAQVSGTPWSLEPPGVEIGTGRTLTPCGPIGSMRELRVRSMGTVYTKWAYLLVDLCYVSADRMLDLVGVPGGPLADAALWHLEVAAAVPLTPAMYRMTLTAPSLDTLRYAPGQDLMLRVPRVGDKVVNRRYTIRAFDPTAATVTIDVSLHGAGPGTDWIRAARVGDRIDAIGPRRQDHPASGRSNGTSS